MSDPDTNVKQLAREIAARLSPDALLNADDVAAMLRLTPRVVREKYALADGFPAAIRLAGKDGTRGHPRWLRSDVVAWIAKHLDGKPPRPGRPRKAV
jgi:predicted DNA-binding transcriptional regulator AlpA